jgi:hypothetical protein
MLPMAPGIINGGTTINGVSAPTTSRQAGMHEVQLPTIGHCLKLREGVDALLLLAPARHRGRARNGFNGTS